MSPLLSPGTRLILVYALPPLLVGVLWAALWLTQDGHATVEIRDGETLVETGTRAEALDFAKERTGMRPLLPAVLPEGGYELVEVRAVPGRPPSTGYAGVYFMYESKGDEPSRFWVDQFVPGSVDVPNEFLPVVTTIDGARIWTLGAPPERYEPGPGFQFVFMAKTARYDRIVVFEGARPPDTERAREVIESMLPQE